MAKRSRKPEQPHRGRADLPRLRKTSEATIARTSPPELAGLPPGFWADAELVVPVPKEAISLRVDQDVLAWFRAQGARYQSRMNAVLRTYVAQARRRRPTRRSRPRRPASPGLGSAPGAV
jgi:uncharacterized protein (DUF4415 family)